jgi:hypothetical protein
MEWYYAEGGEQRGPVSDEQLRQLAGAGKILPNSLVWCAGMEQWLPYASVLTGAPAAAATGGNAKCVECGNVFSTEDMIRFGNSWVCASCKPIFFQRVTEGAPPPASVQLWRSGRVLVMSKEALLPDRCVKCNEPVHGRRLKRNLYWHSQYVYLLIVLNLLIYAIVALIVRKRAKIQIGICGRHLMRRRIAIAIGWVAGLGGFMLFAASLTNNWGSLALIGFLLFLGGLIFGAVVGPVVSAKKIGPQFVWVKGVCQPYLETLPEWTETT